jgi:thymidylate kinase
VSYARAGDWEALEGLAPALRANWTRRPPVDSGRRMFRRRWQALTDLLSLVWWRRRGLSVALLGPDGAGKSTLAQGIKGSSIFPVHLAYMGLTGGALPYADRLLLPGLVQLGRIGILWSRYVRGLYHQVRGRLVVFDRYIYDAMTPHPERLNWYRRATRWIDGHACPGPDLVLVLNAPGETMYERKGEYTPAMLEDWRQHFLALQHWLPQLELVDTTRTAEEVCADVMDRIWRRYAARLSEHYSCQSGKNKDGGVST